MCPWFGCKDARQENARQGKARQLKATYRRNTEANEKLLEDGSSAFLPKNVNFGADKNRFFTSGGVSGSGPGTGSGGGRGRVVIKSSS